jgi:DNA mismatch endonuclease (patch repair protein)
VDNLTPAQRHKAMKNVKAIGTNPELAIRKLLCSIGEKGYRLNRKDISGKPDIAFIKRRKAIFIHGCFWHGHNCPLGQKIPATNREYWILKIKRNRERDMKVLATLAKSGWNILIIWECEIKELSKIKISLQLFLRRTV